VTNRSQQLDFPGLTLCGKKVSRLRLSIWASALDFER
jgi:hypothetical protein